MRKLYYVHDGTGSHSRIVQLMGIGRATKEKQSNTNTGRRNTQACPNYNYVHLIYSIHTRINTNYCRLKKNWRSLSPAPHTQMTMATTTAAQYLLGLDGREAPALLKIPQKMQPGTLGEGGSRAGATRRVRKPWTLSSLRRRCSCSPAEPTLRECLSSFNSTAASSGCLWLPSCDMSRSSQTKPDEPDLLNVCEDLCSPAMVSPPFSLCCLWMNREFLYGVAYWREMRTWGRREWFGLGPS